MNSLSWGCITDVPESQGVQGFDRYAYANNNPLRYSDPSGHSIWDTVGQFATGFVYEFARTTAWYSPHAQNVLSVNAAESDAMLAGRVAADIANIAIGVGEVAGGIALGTAGTAVSCVATLCTAAVVTVGAGAVAVGAGAMTALAGAAGLGGNLALLSGNEGSGSPTGSTNPLDDIFNDPNSLAGKTPGDMADIIDQARANGWEIGSLGRGSQAGQGLMIREVVNGKYTGRIIQWHPGGGHHGPSPYWKVSSPTGGTVRVGPQFPK